MRTRNSPLHATWLHGHRPPLWDEFDRIDQLLLMSCFVSPAGWALLEESMHGVLAKNPRAEIRLYLSMEGIGQVGSASLIDDIFGFLARHEHISVGSQATLQLWIVRDDRRSLFHPKGYALKAGGSHVTVVRSANTTRAAQSDNYEMEAELTDPASFIDFVRAAKALEESGAARRFNIDNIEQLRRFAGDKEQRRRAFARTAAAADSARQRKRAARELEEGHTPATPLDLDFAETLEGIRRAFKVGLRLVSQDMGIPNHSVPLQRFVKAGVLAKPTRRDLRAGVVVSSQKRSPSILVNLAPKAIVEKIGKINQRQAAVLGLFSLEMLGFRWLPCAWEPTFKAHLETCRVSVGQLSLEEVERHLEEISDWLSSPDFAQRLAPALPIVRNTARWNLDFIRDTLREPVLLKLAKARRALEKDEHPQVYAAICDYVREDVMNQLDKGHTRLQVETAGALPRLDDPPELGRNDALDFVATMIELRGSSGGTGVRRVLAGWPAPDPALAARIQSNVLRIRRFLIGRDELSDDKADRLLIDAWRDLCATFPNQQFPLDWAEVVPHWAPSWSASFRAPALPHRSTSSSAPQTDAAEQAAAPDSARSLAPLGTAPRG